jgi:L-alanine-DL-glutamate epimerase-like enolase superfamily enzyme
MAARLRSSSVPIERIDVSAYRMPTDSPESDGTYEWDSTTMVLVEAVAGGRTGLGYSYADTATAQLVHDLLANVVKGRDAMGVPGAYAAMVAAVRNLGRPGIASMAISAVDVALWDLKARLLDVALVTLLGAVRDAAPVYGSGGFTSYAPEQLRDQLGGWAAQGIPRVKMKVGRHSEEDLRRVRTARDAIGRDADLFVDANGAYTRKQALAMAEAFADLGVIWFEEPVSSDDLDGLRLMRDRAPAGMDIVAGEYGYDLFYFRRMLDAGAVDVLQADGTRRGGITGYLGAGVLCEALGMPFSAHCAPSLHAHPSCSLPAFRHLEYFHDHARIEQMIFDGALTPVDGALRPDPARPGLGLEFKRKDATRYAL